ncbi:MAG: hypothetical protein P8L30_03465 [Longimicrobiales bacterium]|nr:hypothetical protein [Longimicrobiales bacterium]
MHESFYDTEAGIVFLRFEGAVVGAETQTAALEAFSQLDDPSSVRGLLLDYREVTAMDMVDSDRALFSITMRRLEKMGVDFKELPIGRVSDPTRLDVAAMLDRRFQVLEHTYGHDSEVFRPYAQKTMEFQLEEAFRVLGLPEDYRLPY